jgi:hypothetical protein
MYPNTALSAWQLAIMAVVAMSTLIAWLVAIFLAAREPGGQSQAAAGSAPGAAAADTGSRTPEVTGAR